MPAQPTLIAMPRLGMTMQEGRLVEWRVAEGAAVARGHTLFVIESDKSEVEVEAPVSGFLRHVFVAPGATVACGEPLAALTERPDEPFDPAAFLEAHGRGRGAPTVAKTPPPARAPQSSEPAAPARSTAPLTPAARVRARELGVDLARVRGTGPGGRITREDVEAGAAALAARREVAPGVWLEVRESGQGPLALLLPGFGSDVSVFARLVPGLARQHRLRAVNLRGVGLSDAPGTGALGLETFVADAAALVDEGAHVVGASLGAAVALGAALADPARVRSLALLTPVGRPDGRLLAVVEAWARLAARLEPLELATALVPWMFSSRFLGDEARRTRAIRGFAAAASQVPADTVRRMAEGLRAWGGFDAAALSSLRVPVLVVAAEEDLLTPDAESLAAAIPGARLARVAGSGHAVSLEAGDSVEALLREHWVAAERGAA
jgi:pyruvate dehydrogenase E2 component (dihydrolipoamide acetyltransferase)